MKAKETNQRGLKMNLQLFADADNQPSQADVTAQAMAILQGGGNEPQAPAAPQGQPMVDGQSNPQNSPQLVENGGQVQGNLEGQQTHNQVPTEGQPSQAPQNADALILGKFKSPEELASAYASLEQFNTRTRQELSQTQQTTQQLQAALEQMQQQIQQSVVQPQNQEPELSPEEMNEQFMNKFYENPTATLQEMLKQMVEPQIAPIQQQYQAQQQEQQWMENINKFASTHQDFEQWQPAMWELMGNDPSIANAPNGLDIAYNYVKGQNHQDPVAMLQNQDFVKQNILGNPDIKNQIIQEYLQSLKQGQQAPTVINSQPGGAMPMTPENKPQTIKDARDNALKMLQG